MAENENQLIPTASGETITSAVAAQAVANVQARYAIAKKMPRDMDQVRVALLAECNRPRFAEVALYHKPIGQGVTGPSIRFAEAAIRCMGNILPEVATLFDDENKRILRVSVTDLENNVTYSKDVTITKTVERKKIVDGQFVISSRVNSYGKTVYTVKGTDDDVLNKENALVSKALRTVGLRLIPGDILDEALDRVQQTLSDGAKGDPIAARKRLVDSFAAIGIQPKHLIVYLGHSLEQVTPAEITKLRGLYSALRDGETTWSEVMDGKEEKEEKSEPNAKTNATKEALEARRNGKAKKQNKPKEEKTEAEKKYENVGPPPLTDEEQESMEGAGF